MKTRTQQTLQLLRDYESRNITFIESDGSWPIVWDRAHGETVWDAEGRRYLDLTAAFGVAACGHANPRVIKAGQRQMGRLLHAMGDVHPHSLKARLARELSRITFERWMPRGDKGQGTTTAARGKTIFCNSGFEAVEAALKTALLATGKPGIIAFEGAYHGLGYGALNATHRAHFRSPFLSQMGKFGVFAPFPRVQRGAHQSLSSLGKTVGTRQAPASSLGSVEATLRRHFKTRKVGAVLVEPLQVRGGINIPPPEFLPMLRSLCDEEHALLVLDEIYTGFGRTGKWFACEHSGVVPDLVCLGKALTGGFPLSVCVGRAAVMDAAWPASTGEAIHTSTFLGHPVGCAMALAQIEELQAGKLIRQSEKLGNALLKMLESVAARLKADSAASLDVDARGLGLLAGLEIRHGDGAPATELTLLVIKGMLRRGFILLPEGEHSNVISFTPPLTISGRQLRSAVRTLKSALLATCRKSAISAKPQVGRESAT